MVLAIVTSAVVLMISSDQVHLAHRIVVSAPGTQTTVVYQTHAVHRAASKGNYVAGPYKRPAAPASATTNSRSNQTRACPCWHHVSPMALGQMASGNSQHSQGWWPKPGKWMCVDPA
ncbi:hypothetical protein K431DRAFT_100821 [Polychaeton citri CBS 116435]|uniref:Secreted protein n=1 Tax=Polychaeton citri CBS 116435 TaxID=1314669 RepID=A0A9P4QI68_9PEZI|nr:hypothetical protein K431DRAFT_100821 [Polychaeton citri CBS 116435]